MELGWGIFKCKFGKSFLQSKKVPADNYDFRWCARIEKRLRCCLVHQKWYKLYKVKSQSFNKDFEYLDTITEETCDFNKYMH